jgi:hypothetical protein
VVIALVGFLLTVLVLANFDNFRFALPSGGRQRQRDDASARRQ